MKISQILTSTEARVDRAILVADMTGTKALAQKGETEDSLLEMAGWFFDIATEAIEQAGGTVVKYQEDAVKAAFYDPSQAIEAAIQIQEGMAEGNQQRNGSAVNCSIGIATGSVITLPGSDFTGVVTVVARHLSLAASAKAIFADTATVSGSSLGAIKSKYGESQSPKRTGEQYSGDVQQITLKIAPQPLEYYEINWDQEPYGAKASASA